MARWRIISGARPFHRFPGREVEIGWARDLQRGETQVTVNVCVSPEAYDADELPEECRRAIRSHGRSVINDLLGEEEVPTIVDVTTAGLERVYPSPEEDAAGAAQDGEDDSGAGEAGAG